MVYCCENEICRFQFERRGTVENCPDCGSQRVRLADDKETAEYENRLARGDTAQSKP